MTCDLARNCCRRDGIYKNKGRLRCHKRPKSKGGMPQGRAAIAERGSAIAYPLPKTIAINGSIEHKVHGAILRFMPPLLQGRCRASQRPIKSLPSWRSGAWGGTDVADVGIRKPTLHRAGRLHGRAGAGGGGSALTGSENSPPPPGVMHHLRCACARHAIHRKL
jgi:hypothetical protein